MNIKDFDIYEWRDKNGLDESDDYFIGAEKLYKDLCDLSNCQMPDQLLSNLKKEFEENFGYANNVWEWVEKQLDNATEAVYDIGYVHGYNDGVADAQSENLK